MHPPVLALVAGRPKTERHKGTGDKKKKKGQHQFPICMDYGHIGIIAREENRRHRSYESNEERTKKEGKEYQNNPKFHCAFRGRCTSSNHVFSSKSKHGNNIL
ncbi:hypothetical protein BDA96_05G105400 [Sorghum bicolor]|uniref:Uncharacterized protein n=2 Tax=Sorghum bicolor TaxID=4558 RepID=A0A921QXI5_SORBI|nr:hypothetical protein BDA96_05G105400 [Sorghum bicolor]OQU83277.1 hypothetical protein SORBI_3005G101850 [Sorghum bicolor]